jgi:hypothetical protein
MPDTPLNGEEITGEKHSKNETVKNPAILVCNRN